MARPRMEDRSAVAEKTLTLRLTQEERALLEELVKLRASRLASEGGAVSASSVLRALIRREAEAEGLLPKAKPAKKSAVAKKRA